MAANAEGVYVEVLKVVGGAQGPVGVAGFDAATGAERFFIKAFHKLLGVADAGVYTAELMQTSVTVRRLAPAGNELWQRRLQTAAERTVDALDAVREPDGGVIIVGRTEAEIDFGDLQLADGEGAAFVAELSPIGVTRWAFANSAIANTSVALSSSGDILLGGLLDDFRGPDGLTTLDSFVAVATPTGVSRLHRVGGRGTQRVESVEAGRDGLAWVHVTSEASEEVPEPTVEIAGYDTDETGSFVFLLVP
jgi:hypothetical protein